MSHMNSMNTLARLMKEIRSLARKPLEDIEIRLDDSMYGGSNDSLESIEATVKGPKDTPFENGQFTIRLQFGNDFPNSPPKGYFLTKIFHPNVAPNTGEICVNTLKRDWKPKYGIRHILIAIRSLLIVPNHDSALNQEAGKLLLESYDEYANRAKLYTKIHAIPQENQNDDDGRKDDSNENNQNDGGSMTLDDDSSELDASHATNENEEVSNKPQPKTKSKEKSVDNEDGNAESEVKDGGGNDNRSQGEVSSSNTKRRTDDENVNNENSAKSNKLKSKEKHKKKSKKSKAKAKGRLSKSMMRL